MLFVNRLHPHFFLWHTVEQPHCLCIYAIVLEQVSTTNARYLLLHTAAWLPVRN